MHDFAFDRDRLAQAVKEAGHLALGYFNRTCGSRKEDRTVVTEADRVVELFLRERCAEVFPQALFIGEETEKDPLGEKRTWVAVDPIDGTSAFVAGIPTWCVSVGLLHEGRPVAGAVYLPVVDELYLADCDRAWWNGRQLERRPRSNVGGDRFVVAYAGFHRRHSIPFAGKVRSLGSTAYHICLVARGAAMAALLGRAHIWDLAAGAALLEATGGRLVYLSGRAVDWYALGGGAKAADFCVAARAEELRQAIDLFRSGRG